MKNSKIKRTIIFIIVLIFFINGLGLIFGQVGDADTFDSINKPTEENTKYIQKAEAKNVFNMLDENLQFFDKLYNKVKATDDIDTLVDELEEGFGKLAASFKTLADNKDKILKEFNNRLNLLEEYGNRSVNVKDKLDIEINSLNNEKKELAQKMETFGPDSTEAKKAKMRYANLESRMTALRTRRNVWESYVATHQELRKNLGELTENISLFLYSLEQTAEVYEEAYETLKFTNRASQAIDSLEELANIDTYTEGLLNTFEQVDEIMLKLNNIDFESKTEDVSFLFKIPFMLLPVSCTTTDEIEEITWKEAMKKYKDLVDKRDEVIRLMQEKSRAS